MAGARGGKGGLGCGEAQWWLCRLAAGETLQAGAVALARHVRDCAACDGFADELGELHRWLARGREAAPRGAPLVSRARAALVRELEARLARDLLDLATGRGGRGPRELSADLARLEVLVGEEARREGRLAPVAAILRDGRPASRHALLGLAASLDPLGLDVALAWLASLVRAGETRRADALADRLLLDVG